MSSPIMPYVTRLITSPRLRNLKRTLSERRRVRKHQPHLVTVYLRINDPYSYLLLQVLEQLASRYPLEYEFRTVLNLQPQMYPAPDLWKKNAFVDGAYLARLYDLRFPATEPVSTAQRDTRLTAQLLHWELQPGYLGNARALFDAYWLGEEVDVDKLLNPNIVSHVECYQHHLQANEHLLESEGHYLSGMLHYGGEWYWGLDRLEHLELRLNALGLARTGVLSEVQFNRGHRVFCRQLSRAEIPEVAGKRAVEIFWSLRSPYSYIGLVRARQLAAHYNVPLVVKPVLPMVMRRMQVPRAKRFYITLDVKREAEKYGIDFGFIADPLGKGVERCYALYDFAKSRDKGVEFLESYARGVWAEGIRSDTDDGLQKLVERVGLSWQEARTLLDNASWRVSVQDNLAELYGHGLWGVPSFVYGDLKVFGQDRVDCLERAIVSELQAAGPATADNHEGV
jgi:2-hydroxychromene-2-carboxylate isomerase